MLNSSYSLWTKPWITVIKPDGSLETVSLTNVIENAHRYYAIYEYSPPGRAAIHRFLTAVLMDALQQPSVEEWRDLWAVEKFPKINNLRLDYLPDLFDLFGQIIPFFQSADLPPTMESLSKELKPASTLWPETPNGNYTTFWRRYPPGNEQIYCPPCLAVGLLLIPAFSTVGGQGFPVGVNGTGLPIYLLPQGKTLFHSLMASLPVTSPKPWGTPWWRRGSFEVERRGERGEDLVGLLDGLTFMSRKVRLYPEHIPGRCGRCGREVEWGVRSIIHQPGEMLAKTVTWHDPFGVYHREKGYLQTSVFQREKRGISPVERKRRVDTGQSFMLDQARELRINEELTWLLTGLSNSQANWLNWFEEEVEFFDTEPDKEAVVGGETPHG